MMHGPEIVFPGLMLTLALIVDALPVHETAVPAMMPLSAACPRSMYGAAASDETVTVANADCPPAVAWMVFANVPVVKPAVNNPLASIDPPPLTTDHCGEIGTTLPEPSRATAANCCVPPVSSVAGLGVTVIVASAPEVTVTVALAEMLPLVAFTVLV